MIYQDERGKFIFRCSRRLKMARFCTRKVSRLKSTLNIFNYISMLYITHPALASRMD